LNDAEVQTLRERDLTWVISAEVTHRMTTVKIRSMPALYLQPMGSDQERRSKEKDVEVYECCGG